MVKAYNTSDSQGSCWLIHHIYKDSMAGGAKANRDACKVKQGEEGIPNAFSFKNMFIAMLLLPGKYLC